LRVESPGQVLELDLAQFLSNWHAIQPLYKMTHYKGLLRVENCSLQESSQREKVLQGFLEAEFHHVMRQLHEEKLHLCPKVAAFSHFGAQPSPKAC